MATVENLPKIPIVDLPKPLAPGSLGKAVELVTNLSRIELDESRTYHQYHVKVNEKYQVNGEDRVRVLSEEVRKNDFLDQRHKRAVVAIFSRMLTAFPQHFNGSMYHIFDREAILFTMNEIAAAAETELVLTVDQTGIQDLDENLSTIEVVIIAARNNEGQHVKVRGSAIKDIIGSESNKSILGALNLAVSQQPFFDTARFRSYRNGNHYLIPQATRTEGFAASDFPDLPEGKTILAGVSEAVKVLAGDVPYVVTDVKKGAFHTEGIPLWTKILAMFPHPLDPVTATPDQRNLIERQLRGLFVNTTYVTRGNRRQNIRISGLGGNCLQTHVQMEDGTQVPLHEYYRTKYNVVLEHPEYFTVIGRPNCLYPIELLTVGTAQRVSMPQQTSANVATLIKACAMKPQDRLRQTKVMKGMVGLNADSERLREYGLKVSNELQTVQGRVMPTPKVLMGADAPTTLKDNCKWTCSAKFVEAKTIPPWVVVGLVAGHDKNLMGHMNEFIKRFKARCQLHGMVAPDPCDLWMFNNPTREQVESCFGECVRKGYGFLLFLSSDKLTHHEFIKYNEVRHQLLTQELRLSCLRNVVEKNQNMTMDNIVAKTNMKLGGLNHIVRFNAGQNDSLVHSDERVIVGFDVMNPSKVGNFEMESKEDPWVLGWSANCSTHALKFVGDYLYVKARDETSVCVMMSELMVQILDRFYKNRQVVPKHVYVYFNGVSEGQWETIASSYKTAMKTGIATMYKDMEQPKFVLLVCSKSHNERLYKKIIEGPNSAAQNIMPGTVVDKTITGRLTREFYLNSHSAFQGTAKTPKYTVLADENDKPMPLDAHESIAHALCFLHEIVTMTISVPAPLMIADRCAKRGHAVYKIAKDVLTNVTLSAEVSNVELTNHGNAIRLANGSSLVNQRFNA